jgi:phage tail-like protein
VSGNWLAPRLPGPIRRAPSDFRALEEVVRVGFPIHDARTFLARSMGNPVEFRLAEARRGERLGHVREAEVVPAGGGPSVWVRAERTLPDGSPATYFVPEDLIELRAVLEVDGGGQLPVLGPNDRIVLYVPVKSYLRFLPGIYQGASATRRRDLAQVTERSARQWGARPEEQTTAVDVHAADQFRRFLFLFQHLMTTVTDRIDRIPQLTDPMTADPRFLPWVASWVGFELDESLPVHQQRELVRRSIRLYRTRGTRAGLEEMIEVLTGTRVRVAERQKPRGAVLGQMTLAGGRTVEERYERGEPPATYIVRPDRAKTTFFCVTLERRDLFARRFGERASGVLRRISWITTHEKPGHVTFTIAFAEGSG